MARKKSSVSGEEGKVQKNKEAYTRCAIRFASTHKLSRRFLKDSDYT